jgi:energy-coupling factor transporter ATP-binding protein EcfA2
MAADLSRRVSRDLYTPPMPPAPMADWISYGPRWAPDERGMGCQPDCSTALAARRGRCAQGVRRRAAQLAWRRSPKRKTDLNPPPMKPTVFIGNRDVSRLPEEQAAAMRLRDYGFVFQQPMLVEGLSIMDNVLLSVGVQGKRPSAASRRRAADLPASLGLAGTSDTQPRLLSGGMKQRPRSPEPCSRVPPPGTAWNGSTPSTFRRFWSRT